MRNMFLAAVLAGAALLSAGQEAQATSGPGCLIVYNVSSGDALYMRSKPVASARVVDALVPGQHGIIHLDAPCAPKSKPWGQRWSRVSHYNGNDVTHGYVKARFVRDSDCP